MTRPQYPASSQPSRRSPGGPVPTFDRAAWAWEWLRRNPQFRSASRWAALPDIQIIRRAPSFVVLTLAETSAFARDWRLIAPESPERDVGAAQIFWRPDAHNGVLSATADPGLNGDTVDFRALPCAVAVLKTPGEEHVRLTDGTRSIQFVVRRGTVLNGPVVIRFDLSSSGVLRPRYETMRRFMALKRTNQFPHALFTPPPHAVWWVPALAAFDAEQAGLPRPQIAARLFGPDAAGKYSDSEWMRSRVRRALKMAEKLVNGGYRQILNPSRSRFADQETSTGELSLDEGRPLSDSERVRFSKGLRP